MKTKIILPQVYVTLADFGYPIKDLSCFQIFFKSFGFPVFRHWAYLVKVFRETRDAY